MTRYSDRDSPDKIHFRTADKKEISSIATGELSYSDHGYSALYFLGESHNYMQRHGVELGWQPASWAENRLKFASQVYYNHGLQDWTRMSTRHKTFDDDAYHYAMYAEWRAERWKHKVGASYTRASLDNGNGLGALSGTWPNTAAAPLTPWPTVGVTTMWAIRKRCWPGPSAMPLRQKLS